jgi:molybdopterin converting factor small subunit
MHLQFFGPFDKLIEREIHLDLNESITLAELIHLLSSRYDAFAQYGEKKTDADLSAHVVFLKEGRPLKLADNIENSDTVKVLLPVAGGQ